MRIDAIPHALYGHYPIGGLDRYFLTQIDA
jgi:hypothetical protein